jgi:hypothetical protein
MFILLKGVIFSFSACAMRANITAGWYVCLAAYIPLAAALAAFDAPWYKNSPIHLLSFLGG